jgi:hypothetical protein
MFQAPRFMRMDLDRGSCVYLSVTQHLSEFIKVLRLSVV